MAETMIDTIRRIVAYIDCREHFAGLSLDNPPPLSLEDYQYLSGYLKLVLEKNSEDSLLWFWKGWMLHFLDTPPSEVNRHPNFEEIEDCYEMARRLDEGNGPAAMMLTKLKLDNALFEARERTAGETGWDLSELSSVRYYSLAHFELKLDTEDSPEAEAIRENDNKREREARSLWASARLSDEQVADIRSLAASWLSGSGATIAERVYNLHWIYDGEPVAAFHTDYIGWLWLMEDMLPYVAPEGQAGRLLYELALAWDEYEDPQHPLRGEFFDKALDWGIEEPGAYFHCLTLALRHLSETTYDCIDLVLERLNEGIRWTGNAENQNLLSFDELSAQFADAMLSACRTISIGADAPQIVRSLAPTMHATIAPERVDPAIPSERDEVMLRAREARSEERTLWRYERLAALTPDSAEYQECADADD